MLDTSKFSSSAFEDMMLGFGVFSPIAFGAVGSFNAIQLAIDEAFRRGGGTVLIPTSDTYPPSSEYMNGVWRCSNGTPLTPRSGVSIKGSGYVVSATERPIGGTILFGDGVTDAIAYNPTNGSVDFSTTTEVRNDAVRNIEISGLALSGFRRGLSFGSLYRSGVFYGRIANVATYGCTDWGFYFENCSQCDFENIRVDDMASGATGHMYFGASTTAYNHGNSAFRNLFAETLAVDGLRGIVFNARGAGAKLNDLHVHRMQCNQGGTKITQAATMTNASADIGVTDGTKFPLDMPCMVSATINGFTTWRTYFVVSQIGNTVQIGELPRGAATVATGNSAVNLIRHGFACVEIVGNDDNSGNIIQPSTFIGIDVEGVAGCGVLVSNATIPDLVIGTCDSTQGTAVINSLVLRDADVIWGCGSQFTLDVNSNFRSVWCKGGRPNMAATAPVPYFPIMGMYYDTSNGGRPVFNMAPGPAAVGAGYGLIGNGGLSGSRAFIYPNGPTLGRSNPAASGTATQTLTPSQFGILAYTNSGAATWTLPDLVEVIAAGGSNNFQGAEYTIINAASAAVAIALTANTGDFFNGDAAKTVYSVPRYGSITVAAAWNATTAKAYWAVVGNNGAT